VIVKNKEIVATGYNGSPRGEVNCCDTGICYRIGHAHNDGNYDSCRSVHAEMNAIISASRAEMLGSTLYLVGFEDGEKIVAEPCPICQRLIKNAGIEKVIV
jgi:dCMP deaminase